jgi:GNAT superfamily N-acetyltransferase
MEFRPIRFDQAAIAQYCALFKACFPGVDIFTPAYLQWLYADNPDGKAVGFDAWESVAGETERLAAHYVCVPATARINGTEGRVLLSLNTATHPDFQGKGLFTKLAALTYEAGAQQGFIGCYGVANANSTPGFIRKLGFQLVRPLEARVGMGSLPDPAPENQVSFQRTWSHAALAWRCASPRNRVSASACGAKLRLHARAFGLGLPAYAELTSANAPKGAGKEFRSPLRLYLGLLPDAAGGYGAYVSIPNKLRPSPLNLIWRPFQDGGAQLDASRIHFTFLDFDAY